MINQQQSFLSSQPHTLYGTRSATLPRFVFQQPQTNIHSSRIIYTQGTQLPLSPGFSNQAPQFQQFGYFQPVTQYRPQQQFILNNSTGFAQVQQNNSIHIVNDTVPLTNEALEPLRRSGQQHLFIENQVSVLSGSGKSAGSLAKKRAQNEIKSKEQSGKQSKIKSSKNVQSNLAAKQVITSQKQNQVGSIQENPQLLALPQKIKKIHNKPITPVPTQISQEPSVAQSQNFSKISQNLQIQTLPIEYQQQQQQQVQLQQQIQSPIVFGSRIASGNNLSQLTFAAPLNQSRLPQFIASPSNVSNVLVSQSRFIQSNSMQQLSSRINHLSPPISFSRVVVQPQQGYVSSPSIRINSPSRIIVSGIPQSLSASQTFASPLNQSIVILQPQVTGQRLSEVKRDLTQNSSQISPKHAETNQNTKKLEEKFKKFEERREQFNSRIEQASLPQKGLNQITVTSQNFQTTPSSGVLVQQQKDQNQNHLIEQEQQQIKQESLELANYLMKQQLLQEQKKFQDLKKKMLKQQKQNQKDIEELKAMQKSQQKLLERQILEEKDRFQEYKQETFVQVHKEAQRFQEDQVNHEEEKEDQGQDDEYQDDEQEVEDEHEEQTEHLQATLQQQNQRTVKITENITKVSSNTVSDNQKTLVNAQKSQNQETVQTKLTNLLEEQQQYLGQRANTNQKIMEKDQNSNINAAKSTNEQTVTSNTTNNTQATTTIQTKVVTTNVKTNQVDVFPKILVNNQDTHISGSQNYSNVLDVNVFSDANNSNVHNTDFQDHQINSNINSNVEFTQNQQEIQNIQGHELNLDVFQNLNSHTHSSNIEISNNQTSFNTENNTIQIEPVNNQVTTTTTTTTTTIVKEAKNEGQTKKVQQLQQISLEDHQKFLAGRQQINDSLMQRIIGQSSSLQQQQLQQSEEQEEDEEEEHQEINYLEEQNHYLAGRGQANDLILQAVLGQAGQQQQNQENYLELQNQYLAGRGQVNDLILQAALGQSGLQQQNLIDHEDNYLEEQNQYLAARGQANDIFLQAALGKSNQRQEYQELDEEHIDSHITQEVFEQHHQHFESNNVQQESNSLLSGDLQQAQQVFLQQRGMANEAFLNQALLTGQQNQTYEEQVIVETHTTVTTVTKNDQDQVLEVKVEEFNTSNVENPAD